LDNNLFDIIDARCNHDVHWHVVVIMVFQIWKLNFITCEMNKTVV